MTRTKLSRPPTLQRRDGAGHINPVYAADLLARGRETKASDAQPFVDCARTTDALAEELAEEFVETVTQAHDIAPDAHDQKVTEEDGGPFIETSADTEFAGGTDESNIADATREPFPTT